MEDPNVIFSRLQPRMLGTAYRMLGSLSDAEDVVQDVWARWHDTDVERVDNAEAWLVATTTRRAIDKLRQARTEREKYAGIWLPEPVLTENPRTPEELEETASDLSIAFLSVLERLAPEARAAFLLHEVLEVDYDEIGRILDKSEAACRQIVHRAKEQLRDTRARYVISADAHRKLMNRFVEAIASADFAAMKSMFSESAELRGDGGGVVTSFPEPVVGGARIAQALYAPMLRESNQMRVELVTINGRFGLLRYMHGELESAMSFEIEDGRIARVDVQRNPAKLARIVARQVFALR